jgi:hypothetical protein
MDFMKRFLYIYWEENMVFLLLPFVINDVLPCTVAICILEIKLTYYRMTVPLCTAACRG